MLRLTNAGGLATASGVSAAVSVSDALQVSGAFDLAAGRVLRRDGLPWWNLGFDYGQTVSIAGLTGTWTISGFDNSAYGDGTALLLSGPALTPATAVASTVAVTNRYRLAGTLNADGSFTFAGGVDGLAVGMPVAITGVTGLRTIASIVGTTIIFGGGTMPTGPFAATVSAVRIGGDTIVVTGGASSLAAGGPSSPLVIYGDTSQDGLWYGGNPSGISLHNFGSKPLPHEEGLTITAARVSATSNQGTLVRADGGSWITDGFAVGQQLTVDASAQQSAFVIRADGTITRNDGLSWSTAGYAVGQQVTIDGTTVGTVATLSSTVLTLGSLTTDYGTFVNPASFASHTVAVTQIGAVYSVSQTTLTLTFLTPNFTQLAGQGTSAHSIGVGNRIGNGAPFFVFQLGSPFHYSGNDVIDAHQAFSQAQPWQLPSIGISGMNEPSQTL